MNIISSNVYSLFVSSRARRSGQVLIEALVGLGALTVGFLGIITLLNRSLSLNRVVADNYTATYLAAEGIEVVKNLIDANNIAGGPWNCGFNNGSYELQYDTRNISPCAGGALELYQDRALRFDPAAGLYGYVSGNPTGFKRKITVELVGANEIKTNSVVSWVTRGGGNFNINLEAHFYNWRGL